MKLSDNSTYIPHDEADLPFNRPRAADEAYGHEFVTCGLAELVERRKIEQRQRLVERVRRYYRENPAEQPTSESIHETVCALSPAAFAAQAGDKQ
ncbi:hypothetical protein LOS15_07200 [Halomonas sp. 7T]|uniref:hypothetical protein n=1 Tax=Halomonas sp. 7T TaxID=2893469 RepID=UPI0021D93FE6|nr:hypothetical protein [Halomonas sp. 7T]UXZ55797.1 hypothetical protein LOS15_07200 [Halomonas sp. 7T]